MKILKIVCCLLVLVSCSKVVIYETPIEGNFHSEVNLGDSIYCYMNTTIKDDVVAEFVKKKVKTTETQVYDLGEAGFVAHKDTVVCLIENYRDSKEKFYYLLKEKVKQPRDTTIMKFTENNYIQWEVFDEMVNLYDTARLRYYFEIE